MGKIAPLQVATVFAIERGPKDLLVRNRSSKSNDTIGVMDVREARRLEPKRIWPA